MMSELIKEQLERETGASVEMNNISVGGWTVENGLTALTGNVGNYNYPIPTAAWTLWCSASV